MPNVTECQTLQRCVTQSYVTAHLLTGLLNRQRHHETGSPQFGCVVLAAAQVCLHNLHSALRASRPWAYIVLDEHLWACNKASLHGLNLQYRGRAAAKRCLVSTSSIRQMQQ